MAEYREDIFQERKGAEILGSVRIDPHICPHNLSMHTTEAIVMAVFEAPLQPMHAFFLALK